MARPKPRPAPVTSATRPSSLIGRLPRERWLSSLAEIVLGDLDGPRDPHVALAQDVLDQSLDHPHARWPPDDLWMPHQVEEAALLVRALELLLPDLEHVLLAPDAVADRRHGAEA